MKIAVIKIGGKTINDFTSTDVWVNTISDLYRIYDGIIIVHGAGKDITEWSNRLGIESNFVNGQRITTKEMMDVVAAVQAGMLNSKIVAKLNSSGFEASGFSGIDRNTFAADYLDKLLGFVGKPKLIGSIGWILDLLSERVIPVFSSVCCDRTGNLMNVNADLFTGTLSLAVSADTVFFVSDVSGVLMNGNVQKQLDEKQIEYGVANGEIKDGMIPKLFSCMELLKSGINKIWIGSEIKFKLDKQKEINSAVCGMNGSGTWIINNIEKGSELVTLTKHI